MEFLSNDIYDDDDDDDVKEVDMEMKWNDIYFWFLIQTCFYETFFRLKNKIFPLKKCKCCQHTVVVHICKK